MRRVHHGAAGWLLIAGLWSVSGSVQAQAAGEEAQESLETLPDQPSGDDDLGLDDEGLGSPGEAALSVDEFAQESLSGFRGFLEGIQETDRALYDELNPRLRSLEDRESSADIVFGVATGLSVVALVAAIPVYTEVGLDPALGLIIGGASSFVLGLIIQAIIRPGRQDLLNLVDLYDERVGRR